MSDIAITFPILGDGFVVNPQRYIEIFGFKIYWYGLIIALGFIVAVLYLLKRRKVFGVKEDDVYTMIICAVPLGIIGARLYYIIFNFDSFRADTFGEFLKNCLNVRNGGLAIYGGVICGILGLILSAKIRKLKVGTVLDMGAFGVIIGQIFGRWGNFINREAYGVSANVDKFFLRMGLTSPNGTITYVHPTFLYESVWNLIGFIILHFVSKKRKFDGQIFAMYVAWYGLGRFFIEGLRADSLYFFGTSLRVSQALAAISFIVAVMYLILRLSDKAGCDPDKLYVNMVKAQSNNDSENNNDNNDKEEN